MTHPAFAPVFSVLLSTLLGAAARAQCEPQWSSAAPSPDFTGQATCTALWDPDGGGPAPSRLVVGGSQLIGGPVQTPQQVMTFDGTQWQALGDGPGTAGAVTELTVWNGALVASVSAPGAASLVALWTGSTWQQLGPSGFAPPILAVWNGNLVAADNLTSGPAIWIWNGSSWVVQAPPPQVSHVDAMISYQGLLCVSGIGPSGGGGALDRWNGSSWLPSIPANGRIFTLAVRTFSLLSTLYAGGLFSTIGSPATPATRIASTGGGTAFAWSAVGNGVNAPCVGLHVRATGTIGVAIVARTSTGAMLQLVGSSFVAMGNHTFRDVAYHGGAYHGVDVVNHCMRFDGSNWLPVLGHGIEGEVRALTASGDDMIVGGAIQATAGPALSRIARWNGTSFEAMGSGIAGGSVDALVTLGNGDVVAGGQFIGAGGVGAANIASWDGTAWSPLGAGCDQQVLALARMPNGDVVAGGRFATAGGVPCARIARWDGATWSPLGTGTNGDVLALAVRGDGRLFAAGAFTAAGGVPCNRIAQWDGSVWAPLDTGCNGDIHALTVRPNGDVVAVGAFLSAGPWYAERCALWTGTTWAPMAAGSGDPTVPGAVLALPNGDVIAGRGFHEPLVSTDSGVSRWNGSTWSGIGSGLAPLSPAPLTVRAIAQRADGTVLVGGQFGVAGDFVARGLAALSPTCHASVAAYGNGCAAAGPLVMTPESLPWLGSTFRTATTGVAPGSLCLHVTGFAPLAIPLSSLLPEGQPGCSLLTSNDIVLWVLPDAGGTARSALELPLDTALIGFPFLQQMVPLEFDGAGTLVAVRGSNGLAATIGAL
ncbi:MAG: hypothetical protein AB7O97_07725 [Planctomycetota bacterium]